jgi:hypothetical protein
MGEAKKRTTKSNLPASLQLQMRILGCAVAVAVASVAAQNISILEHHPIEALRVTVAVILRSPAELLRDDRFYGSDCTIAVDAWKRRHRANGDTSAVEAVALDLSGEYHSAHELWWTSHRAMKHRLGDSAARQLYDVFAQCAVADLNRFYGNANRFEILGQIGDLDGHYLLALHPIEREADSLWARWYGETRDAGNIANDIVERIRIHYAVRYAERQQHRRRKGKRAPAVLTPVNYTDFADQGFPRQWHLVCLTQTQVLKLIGVVESR